MKLKISKIEIASKFNHLQIRETNEQGEFYRRSLTPDVDVSGEVQEIQEMAEKYWTNEVKDAYAKHQEEAEKNGPGTMRG